MSSWGLKSLKAQPRSYRTLDVTSTRVLLSEGENEYPFSYVSSLSLISLKNTERVDNRELDSSIVV